MNIDIDDVTSLSISLSFFFFFCNLTFLGTSSTPFFLYSFLVITVRHPWREEWSQDEPILRCFRTRTRWILVKAPKNNKE
jgi:hypothetical protein